MIAGTVSDLYARKSSLDAGRSATRQTRLWRADCKAEGLTPGRVFVDPDLSASRYAAKERPDYGALLSHIRASEAEMVSLWEVTRGSRQMGEWIHFLDLCRDMGVLIRVFSEEDPWTYDPRRQRDRETLIKAGMDAEAEVEKIRSRSMSGSADAALEGRPPGPLIDGYRRIYGAPTGESRSASGHRRQHIDQVLDEPRAQLYRWAAQGRLNGVGANTIARILNAFEVETVSGEARWRGGPLMKRLLSPTMEGHRVLNGVIVARNVWPAILDPETAAALRRLHGADVVARGYVDVRLKYLLSGVLVCGLCTMPMSCDKGKVGGKARFYYCDKLRKGCGRLSSVAEPLEATVVEMILARLKEPDALSAFEPVADDSEQVTAQRTLDELTARHAELCAEAAKPGGPSMALVAATERALLPQIEAASALLRQLRTPAVLRGFDPADLAERWNSYEIGERRLVVSSLANLVLSPIGRGRSWSMLRLRQSRWRGQAVSWGDLWSSVGG